MVMTIDQVCKKFGYSENSVKNQFSRTSAAIKKKYGVIITKYKKDGITYYELSDGRADSMYNEPKEIIKIEKNSLTLANFEFFIFLGIIVTPFGVFRGSRKDFLKYIGIPANKTNLKNLDNILDGLMQKGYINFDVDEDYIIVYIRRKIEKEMQLGINLIKHCKRIAEKYNKNTDKISQLIKVWLAMQICVENPPFTDNDIVSLTGLSVHQVRDVRKILMKD